MISLASETISAEELALAAEFLTSGKRLTKGEETSAFEAEFSKEVGSQYAVFVNSGSSANLLVASALKESGKLRNNVVVCPAISWVTTVTPFMHLGFDVILCDADSSSLGLDVTHLEDIFKKSRPSLLVLVHVLGHPNDMEKILRLCEEYGVLLVEDSCEALGTVTTEGRSLGTLGLAGTYSFYYGHHISTIEGGMVVTDDFEFWQIMVSMRSHGWSRDLDSEKRTELTELYEVDHFRNLYTFFWPGFNFRSTDFQAFIGRLQLKKLPQIVEVRERNFERYVENLDGFFHLDTKQERLSSFAFGTAVANRLELSDQLLQRGIESRPLVCGNIGRHPFWQKKHQVPKLPVADFIHDFGIYLPNHAELSTGQVDEVCDTMRQFARPLKLEI